MALFERMARRAEAVAEARRRQAEAACAGIPGVEISRDSDRLVLSGRGLVRRWLEDSGLRFAMWSR